MVPLPLWTIGKRTFRIEQPCNLVYSSASRLPGVTAQRDSGIKASYGGDPGQGGKQASPESSRPRVGRQE
jgi:hypothetical protein